MELRQARTSDAGAIMSIYNHEVLTSTATLDLEPRSLSQQQNYIAERSGGLEVVVVETEDSQIAGFGGLSFYRDRPGYRTSLEDSVYVDHRFHSLGVGDLLLTGLLDRAQTKGFHAVFARVVEGADASLRLHTKHGFEVVGVEREVGRKFGRWLDVTLLECLLQRTIDAVDDALPSRM